MYMGSADYESELRGRAEMWKERYEEEMEDKQSAQDMRDGCRDFLISRMQDTVDRVSAAFKDGVECGRKQEAVKTRQVEEELEQARANFYGACSIVDGATEDQNNNSIFIDPNDSPSRSPKKKKKRKSKWGGDRVSAKWKAAHYGSSPARPTGIKQVV